MQKQSESLKAKTSKQFIAHLKDTPQIPQRPKQVPVPLKDQHLPSPIMPIARNRKEVDDVKQCPIEKICFEQRPRPGQKDQTLRERKNQNLDGEFGTAYPQHLRRPEPSKTKDQSSLVKKAREQRMSRSLIDMSIYNLLDETSDRKAIKDNKKDRYLYETSLNKQTHTQKSYSAKQDLNIIITKPQGQRNTKKANPKKVTQSIKVVDRLKKKENIRDYPREDTYEPRKYKTQDQYLNTHPHMSFRDHARPSNDYGRSTGYFDLLGLGRGYQLGYGGLTGLGGYSGGYSGRYSGGHGIYGYTDARHYPRYY